MELRGIRPLKGAKGYPQWKESMLLLLNTVGVAHVLTEDPPASGGDVDGGARAAARQWARDDAVCRGHILRALSRRLFPDYVRHATGAAVWLAVARTYDVTASAVAWRRFLDLEIDGGEPLPEQVAHAEALGVAGHGTLADGVVANRLVLKLPQDVHRRVEEFSDPFDDELSGPLLDDVTMETIWGVVRVKEESRQRMVAGVVAMADMPSPVDED